jgi:hypothetical protein
MKKDNSKKMDKNGVARKDTAGVPRITAAVVGMTPEQREVWFKEKTVGLKDAQIAEVRSRVDALNAGKYEIKGGQGQGQGRKVDFQKLFERATAADLLAMRPLLNAAIDAKRQQAIDEIAAQEKALAERKAALGVTVTVS